MVQKPPWERMRPSGANLLQARLSVIAHVHRKVTDGVGSRGLCEICRTRFPCATRDWAMGVRDTSLPMVLSVLESKAQDPKVKK